MYRPLPPLLILRFFFNTKLCLPSLDAGDLSDLLGTGGVEEDLPGPGLLLPGMEVSMALLGHLVLEMSGLGPGESVGWSLKNYD